MDFLKWARRQWDRSAAIVCVASGLIALILGWLGVSRSTLPAEQIPYLASGAILGLFLLGIGATLWLSADLRDEWRKLEEIHQTMQPGTTDPSPMADASARAPKDARPSSNGERGNRRRRVQASD